MFWEVVGLEISGDKWGLQRFWPETYRHMAIQASLLLLVVNLLT
jgi:hypothetical protein